MKDKFLQYRFFKLIFLIFFIFILISGCNNSTLESELPDEIVIKPEDRLPQIAVNTNGGTIVDEPKISAEITISEADVVTYDGNIGIEFRGASSQTFPKKSY